MHPVGPLFALSVAVGFVLLWPVGWLFGAMGWPMFHGWGLAHGSFVLAWPVLSVATFAVGWLVLRLRNKRASRGTSQ